jgi:SAM-dependent methyltransferase
MTRASSYDEVPYDSRAFAHCQPDHLAALATLFGLTPADPQHCRVLELGCASGGNLIPLAVAFPESTFLGFDLSPRQIEAGAALIEQLRLKNIHLRALSILEVGADIGAFDYILCHGVYSWVPPAVQEKILDICARHLAADGIGLVSYNTHPGWHVRGLIRDMIGFHARTFEAAAEQIEQARALLDLLGRCCRLDQDPYRLLLQRELDLLSQQPDSYLYHEHLEDCNEPLYLHQFVERLQRHGLNYLGDTDIRAMTPSDLPGEVRQELQEIATEQVESEQYLDFLRNRFFRHTLLCRQDRHPDYALSPERLTRLCLASRVGLGAADPDLTSATPEPFAGAPGITWLAVEPICKAALGHLAACWPAAVPFADLVAAARARLRAAVPDRPEAAPEVDARVLAQELLTAYVQVGHAGLELHVLPGPFTTALSSRPLASPLARLQAATGTVVTNLRHETFTLGEFERHLLRYLDGKNDRPRLRNLLADLLERGVLVAQRDGQPVRGTWEIRKLVSQELDNLLRYLAQAALLVA